MQRKIIPESLIPEMRTITKREKCRLAVCILLQLISLVTRAGVTPRATQERPPNIIFILADDLGGEIIGPEADPAYKTPNLDRLASAGMQFTQCYAGPSCSPSRLALMTGKYNHRNYINFSMLPKGERTFGHLLQEKGYRTCILSKWQLGSGYNDVAGSTPAGAGFDEACLKAGNIYWNAEITVNDEVVSPDGTFYGPDVCAEYGLEFIRKNAARPFFLYYAFNLPHAAFDATPDSDDLTSRNEAKNYPAMVTYMDKMVGKVIDQLEELGLRENTLIIFTGDNGTPGEIVSVWPDGKRRRGGKGSRNVRNARVPLFANWPGHIPPGGICNDLIDFTDMYPTIAEAAGGLPAEKDLDGKSFLPVVLGQPYTPRSWIASYFKGRDRTNANAGFFWVYDGIWKLDYQGKLYNIAEDPDENNPVTQAQDTVISAEQRQKLQAVLNELDIDCTNLWVVDKSGKRNKRGQFPVKIYGKPLWEE